MNGEDKNAVHQRFCKERTRLLKLLAVGGIYALWWNFTGIGIPCLIHMIFHVKCPGCGMTRAVIAALHLRFTEAFQYNKLFFTVVPVLAVILIIQEYRYICTGSRKIKLPEAVLLGIMYYVTLVYCIIRNL